MVKRKLFIDPGTSEWEIDQWTDVFSDLALPPHCLGPNHPPCSLAFCYGWRCVSPESSYVEALASNVMVLGGDLWEV